MSRAVNYHIEIMHRLLCTSSTVIAACTKWDKVSNGQMTSFFTNCITLVFFFAYFLPLLNPTGQGLKSWGCFWKMRLGNCALSNLTLTYPSFMWVKVFPIFLHWCCLHTPLLRNYYMDMTRRRSCIDISFSERIRLINKGAARVHCLLSSQ